MTLLNRTLSKAYHRQSISPVAVENKSAGVEVDARGWVPELRAPQRPPESVPVWSWPPICRKLLDAAAEGFRNLADQLLATALERKFKTVALTGASNGIGKSSILLTLAQSLVDNGAARVLLIDADCSHPDLASLLSIATDVSWCEAITQKAACENILIPLEPERLFLLPLGQAVNPQAFTSTTRDCICRHLAEWRTQFDLVLFDGGTWETITQSPLWDRQIVDAVIGITGETNDDTKQIEQHIKLTRETGIEFLGVIETFR